MARLPVPGSDAGNWGTLLNEYLEVSHDTGGALKSSVVANAQVSTGAAISADKLANGTTNVIMTATERTKLTGIAAGATANATDASLRDRSTHTGSQAISTVTNLQTTLDGKAPLASPSFTGAAVFGGTAVVTPDTVTYGASVALNASTGNHFRITMTGNLTLAAPTSPSDGQRILIELIQDGTGGRTLTLNSVFNVTTSITGPITLVTTANTRSYIGAVYRTAGTKWDILAFGTGVAA